MLSVIASCEEVVVDYACIDWLPREECCHLGRAMYSLYFKFYAMSQLYELNGNVLGYGKITIGK